MKKIIMFCIFVLLISVTTSLAYDTQVKGHWKDTNRDGVKDTYVDPYHRTSPNNNPYDNYGTRGNINPYTGQEGTVDPFKQQSTPYKSRSRY